MTAITEARSTCFDLFNEIPALKYPVVFIVNRVIKNVDSIQHAIIPRCNVHDYPFESFIINFQRMSKPDCFAYIYIKGKKTSTWYSVTGGRAAVAWQAYNSPDMCATDLGQVTIQDPVELNDFVKLIDWTWDFMKAYKEEMKENK